MTDFFISYTQADREWARWIKAVLVAAGHSVRIQEDDFPPGSNFAAEMQKALIECERTIAVLSPDYPASRFGMAEWFATFVQDPVGVERKLIPVRVKEVKLKGLMTGIVYIDLVGLGEAAAREELLNGLEKSMGRRQDLVFPGEPFPAFSGSPASPSVADAALAKFRKLPPGEIPAPLPPSSRMPHAVNPMLVGRGEDLRHPMTDFFISYTQADRQWAEWIGWVLEEAGYEVRIQAWDFQPGCNFVEEMNKAARECARTLAVLSRDYFNSMYATQEWTTAFKDGKLLTVRVRDTTVEGLLSTIVYIDLVNLSETAARDCLVNGVAAGRRKPSENPGFPGDPAPKSPEASTAGPDGAAAGKPMLSLQRPTRPRRSPR